MDRPIGALTVDASGFANYHYPITVPPGIGSGNDPDLSLEFSQGVQANGIVGVNWTLGGTSSIMVIQPTLAIDCMEFPANAPANLNYRYALDGMELLCTSGRYGQPNSVYKRELDNGQAAIVTLNIDSSGQQYFVLTDQFGNRQEYGTTADSRVVVVRQSVSTIAEWNIKRSYDYLSNYVEFTYVDSPDSSSNPADSGVSYISTIRYTSNDKQQYTGKMQVVFSYAPRPDPIKAAYWGGLSCTAHRLNRISVSIADENSADIPIHAYDLMYQTSVTTGDSLLSSITEIGSGGHSIMPTIFEYSTPTGFNVADQTWNMFSQTESDISDLAGINNPMSLVPMDLTGRAYTDLACLENSPQTGGIRVGTFLATPSAASVDGNASISWQPQDSIGSVHAQIATFDDLETASIMVADFNSDGRSDLVVPCSSQGKVAFNIAKTIGSGFSPSVQITTTQPWDDSSRFFAIDADANGLLDIVQVTTSSAGLYQITTYFDVYSASVDNPPTFQQSEQWNDNSNTSVIDWFPIQSLKTSGASLVRLSSEIETPQVGRTTIWATIYSTSGNSFTQNAYEIVTTNNVLEYDSLQAPSVTALAADINGDGAEDIVVCTHLLSGSPGNWTSSFTFQSFLFDSDSMYTPQDLRKLTVESMSQQPNAPEEGKFYVMNLDGSRYPSIVYVYEDGPGNWNAIFGMGSSAGQIQTLFKTMITDASNCPSPNPWKLTPTDVTAIARGGFLMQSASTSADTYTVCPIYNVGGISDCLIATTNPLGLRQEIEYMNMSTAVPGFYQAGIDWNGYQPADDGSDVPVFGASTFVVSQVVNKNDETLNALTIGGPTGRTTRYSYGAGLLSRQGRGWKGFATFEELQVETGVRSVSTYNQVWPAAGKLLQQDIFGSPQADLTARLARWPPVCQSEDLNNLQLVSSTVSTYETTMLPNDNGAPISLTTLSKAETMSFDQNQGVNVKQRTMGIEYTYFADTSNIEVEHTYEIDDVAGKTLTEIFKKVSLAPELLGLAILPGVRKVTATSTNSDFTKFETGDLSLVSFTYNLSTGSLASTSTWSSDTNSFSVETYESDGFGNRTSVIGPTGLKVTTTFDPVYHNFAIEEDYVGAGVAHTVYHAYDPRYGVEIVKCDEAGLIEAQVNDEWGRQIAIWGPTTEQSSVMSNLPGSPFPLPTCAVIGPELNLSLQQPHFIAKEQLSYDTVTSPSNSVYLCRSRTTINNDQVVQSAAQTFIDAEGHVRRWRSQDNGTVPVAWFYREFDAHGAMLLDSFPTTTGGGLDWIPSPDVCKILICDAIQRPCLSVLPPRWDGDQYTSLESTYTMGGASKTSCLRQSSSWTNTASGSQYEIIQHQYTRYDHDMRVTQVINNGGGQQNCQYDQLGRILSISVSQQSESGTTTEKRTYNSMGALSTVDNSYQNPTGKSFGVQRRYYDSGLLFTEQNTMGETTTYTYDAKGRVLEKNEGTDKQTNYTYDVQAVGIDRLASVDISYSGSTEQDLQYTYTYDNQGFISSETLVLVGGSAGSYTTSYIHDLQGNVRQKTLPDGTEVDYSWEGGCLMSTSMKSSSTESIPWNISMAYADFDAIGKAETWAFNGTGVAHAALSGNTRYNTLGHPLEMKFGISNGATLVDTTIQYDALEQIVNLSESVSARSTTYTYQDRRLMNSAGDRGNCSYGYDPSGSLVNKNGLVLSYSSSGTGAAVQGSTVGSDQVYQCSYDAAGRAVSRVTPNGVNCSMTYDAGGKMRSLILNTNDITTFFQDHVEHTVLEIGSQTTEIRCGNDMNITINTNGTQTIRRRLFGDDQRLVASVNTIVTSKTDVVTSLETYLTDHKGTITHVYDGTGNLHHELMYDDFGALTGLRDSNGVITSMSTDDDFSSTYECKAYDLKSGLTDFGGRWYDSFIGRFTTPDWNLDLALILKQDGSNLYAFECNNPVNNIDPTGHVNWNFLIGLIVGVVLIAVGVGITIATMGLSTPISGTAVGIGVSMLTGLLIGGGVAAVTYSVQNRDVTDTATFWKGYGVTVAIGMAEGAITGAAGEFLTGAKCLSNIMSISAKSLKVGAAAGKETEQSMTRFLFGVGTQALVNGGGSVASKVATIDAQNAVLGTHQTYTWQDLLETGGMAGGAAITKTLFRGVTNSSPRFVSFKAQLKTGDSLLTRMDDGAKDAVGSSLAGAKGALSTLNREFGFAVRSLRNPAWTGETVQRGSIMLKGVTINY